MTDGINAQAPHSLPFFAPGADGSDGLLVLTTVLMIASIFAIGVVFFWIHSLPERMAHRTQKVQMEIVAVLCLLALLTHIHAFWIAALLLALIDLPTLGRPVERIAGSLERIADRTDGKGSAPGTPTLAATDAPRAGAAPAAPGKEA